MTNPFLSGAVGALSATISVLLVLLYGASATKFLPHVLTEEVINSVTKLGTNILLPCLLFTEMGKEASPSQLKEFWILPVFNISFTLLSLLYSWIGIKLFKFPNWLAPAAAFPNMLSLPLLLIESLSSSGVLDDLLMGKSDTVEKALDRAKIYFLVNGLAGNIVRFALGPYLLNGSDDSDNSDGKKQPERRGVSQDPERAPLLGNAQPGQTLSVYANGQGDGQAEQPEDGAVKATAKQAGYKIADFLNPPLVAAILAIAFGLIGPVRRTLFEEEGALNANFTQSIKTLGKLYTGMQMFILGGKLVSKKAGRAKILPLLYLFLWRFVLVPLIAIGLVYGLRHRFPAYIKEDPMLDFVLAISYVGPPAITLAAIADMSGMDQEEQGVIATVLLASYVFTPFMSLPVSGAMSVISKLYQ